MTGRACHLCDRFHNGCRDLLAAAFLGRHLTAASRQLARPDSKPCGHRRTPFMPVRDKTAIIR
jgi:hypothetical protein